MEIQSLYDRRDKIFKAYKAEPTDPIFLEVIEDKKQRIAFLKGEQTKINTEFWTLVEENVGGYPGGGGNWNQKYKILQTIRIIIEKHMFLC